MSNRITADWDALLRQAVTTSDIYFAAAIKTIRESSRTTGREYATDAEIMAAVALAKVSASDFMATSISVAADKISNALERIGWKNV